MKKLGILYSKYTPTIDAILYKLDGIAEINTFQDEKDINFEKYNMVISVNYGKETIGNILKVHYSLLPSFEGVDPIKQAVLAGVKITGITFFYSKPRQIIAQYPLFIRNDIHYDELVEEIKSLEQTLYPSIVEKLITGKQIESINLIKMNCKASCKGCAGCSN